jgi:hypothetical protein
LIARYGVGHFAAGFSMNDFRWRHFRGEVILWAVRWYCKYGVSYRNLEDVLCERGVDVDHNDLSFVSTLCAGDGKAPTLLLEATVDVAQPAGR